MNLGKDFPRKTKVFKAIPRVLKNRFPWKNFFNEKLMSFGKRISEKVSRVFRKDNSQERNFTSKFHGFFCGKGISQESDFYEWVFGNEFPSKENLIKFPMGFDNFFFFPF